MTTKFTTTKACPVCGRKEVRTSRTQLGAMADADELDLLIAEHIATAHPTYQHERSNHGPA